MNPLTTALAALDAKEFARFTAETWADIGRFLPESVLVLGIAVVVLWNAFLGREASKKLAWVALGTVLLALHLVTRRFGAPPASMFSGMLRIDGFSDFFAAIFLVGTGVSIILAQLSRSLAPRPMGEFHASLLTGALGMMLMAESTDLVMLFVALEMLSLPSYVLVAWIKTDRRSSEAALKYVLYGSVAAAFMLYGISLIYGLTGSTKLPALWAYVQSPQVDAAALAISAFLVFAGLGFKMAAVPLHFWAPDVYQGAPTAVTAWLSVASKAAGVAAFVRFADAIGLGRIHAIQLRPDLAVEWSALAALLAAVTMTLGNLGAMHQTSLKRLLAYSSVAHVGYVLVGIAAIGGREAVGAGGDLPNAASEGMRAVAFYMVAYLVMNLGAFACVLFLENRLGSDDLSAWRGAGLRAPFLAVAFTVFLVALIGIPPTAGFTGKFQLFLAAVDHGRLVWLVVVAALNTAASAYYYLRVIKVMYLDEPEEGAAAHAPLETGERAVLATLAVMVVTLGIFFERVSVWAREIGPLQ